MIALLFIFLFITNPIEVSSLRFGISAGELKKDMKNKYMSCDTLYTGVVEPRIEYLCYAPVIFHRLSMFMSVQLDRNGKVVRYRFQNAKSTDFEQLVPNIARTKADSTIPVKYTADDFLILTESLSKILGEGKPSVENGVATMDWSNDSQKLITVMNVEEGVIELFYMMY